MNKIDQNNCITIKYSGIQRAIIMSVIIESSYNSQNQIKLVALWDTGATCSLIRPEIAKKLNLKYVSKTFINTPSGKNIPSNIYLINMYLPNNKKITNIQTVEGVPNNCDMLIDIISMGDFVITNYDNQTIFSFLIPSIGILNENF